MCDLEKLDDSLEPSTFTLFLEKASLFPTLERCFESIVHAVPSGVYEVDTNGTITYVNNAFLKLFKCDYTEIVGKPFPVPCFCKAFRREAKRYLHGAKRESESTPWVVKSRVGDGDELTIQIDWNHKYNEKDELEGFVGVVSDVTEQAILLSQFENSREYLETTVRELTRSLSEVNEDLEKRQAELDKSQNELAMARRDLSATNHTISLLSRNLERVKKDSKADYHREFALAISTKLLPIIDNLIGAGDLNKRRSDLDTIKLALQELTQPLEKRDCLTALFSTTELKIATLIRNGLTSPKIAQKLCVTEDTVKTHRRNIRRKLGLKNAQLNLKSFLELKWHEASAATQSMPDSWVRVQN